MPERWVVLVDVGRPRRLVADLARLRAGLSSLSAPRTYQLGHSPCKDGVLLCLKRSTDALNLSVPARQKDESVQPKLIASLVIYHHVRLHWQNFVAYNGSDIAGTRVKTHKFCC